MSSRGRPGSRGGYQPPARPAAASPPGRLSQRTDGPSTQPITPIAANRDGGQHGDRQASIEQQRAMPMFKGPSTPDVQADVSAAEPTPGVSGESVWGPTERPWEPVTAGAALGPGGGPVLDDRDETEVLLRAAYAQTRSPYLLRLLGQFGGGA